MAAHLGQQILDRFTTVVTNLTTSGNRVFQNYFYPIGDAELPGLILYDPNDRLIEQTLAFPRLQTRETEVVVEATAIEPLATLNTKLNTMRKEVEVAVSTDPKLNGLAHSVRYLESKKEISMGETGQPIGKAIMSFVVRYGCYENTPDVAA